MDDSERSEDSPNEAEEEDIEVEVHIRQVEPEDDEIVSKLVYDGIYIMGVNRMLMNNMERPYIVCLIGLTAIVTNWLLGGIIVSLFISVLLVPGLIYVFIRFVLLGILKSRRLRDVTTGMYSYWTQPDSGRSMWVAECTERVIGCVAIETVSPMVARLCRLSVETEWQCMGIGGRLTDFALARVKERRFQECVAEVMNVSQEMVNLMNKLGFKKTSSRKIFFRMCELEDYSLKMPGRNSFSDAETSRSDLNG